MAYPYPTPPKKSNKTQMIVIAATLGVCLVCGGIAAGAGIISWFTGSPQAPVTISSQSTATHPASVVAPTKPAASKTVAPTTTKEATIQPEPATQEPTSTIPPLLTSGTFTDDFSTGKNNWVEENTQSHQVGYSQMQNYFITVFQPGLLAYVIPPHPFKAPFANVIISANVKPGSKDGGYGFLCGFQDSKNFYAVKVSGTQYGVYKSVQSKFTFLTNPPWLHAEGIENNDQYGQTKLLVNCMGSSIGVEINGYGQKMVVDSDNSFPSGQAAIFASSGAAETTVNFDDFSMQVNP